MHFALCIFGCLALESDGDAACMQNIVLLTAAAATTHPNFPNYLVVVFALLDSHTYVFVYVFGQSKVSILICLQADIYGDVY